MARASSRGLALAVALAVLAVLTVLGLGLGLVASGSLQTSTRNLASKQEAYTSEAGAVQGLVRLKAQSTYSGAFSHTLPGNPRQVARVTVYNNVFGPNTVTVPNGARMPAGTAYVLATAGSRATGVLVEVSGSLFDYGVFGQTTIFMSGNSRLDAYDASRGSYSATRQDGQGRAGTNANAAGAITLEQNAWVDGTLEVGPGGSLASIDAAPESYLDWSARASEWALPVVTIPATGPSGGDLTNPGVSPAPGRYGDVRVTSGTLNLAAGTYVFDSLTMTGQSLLQVSGNTTIYITGANGGTLDLAGGSVTNDGPPKNLTIKIGPGVTREVVVTGSATAAFGLFAPTADIKVAGGSDIFGALVGRSVTSTGSTAIHYDVSLGSGALGGLFQVNSWERF